MTLSYPARFVLGLLLAAPFGCSAGAGPSDGEGASKKNGANGANQGGGSSSYNGGQAGGEGFVTNGPAPMAPDGSVAPVKCAGLDQKAEVVIETKVIYEPISLFIMQDRSWSMVGRLAGEATRWPNATNALNAFVTDPSSEGINVGIGFFPPTTNAGGDCATGSDCGAPIAPIAALPGNAPAIQQALTQADPGIPPPTIPLLTPTECALRGMINTCLLNQSQTGIKCVAILVTDGEPTTCTLPDPAAANPNQLFIDIVAQGAAAGVPTFAVALPGAQLGLQLLTEVAQAGGTQLIDLTAGGSQAAILAALNTIRSSVTESHEVTTQLDCQWQIPPPQNGQPFDRTRVNVKYTPPAGAPISFGHVTTQNDCGATVDGNGWYYDDPNAPKQVIVCPNTCTAIKAATGASVSLEFGCETVPAKLN